MKIRVTLLLFCLLAGAFTSQTSAQSDKRASQGWLELDWGTPVFCDGEIVDMITGVMKIHYVYMWRDGWLEIDQTHGTGISDATGEVFKYQEIGKVYFNESTAYWKFTAKGEWGTKYIGFIKADISVTPWVMTEIRSICK